MIKKLMVAALAVLAPSLVHAFSPSRSVMISTNTLSRQSGTAVIAGLNVSTSTISSATITATSITTGIATGLTITTMTASSSTVTNESIGTLQVSSAAATNFIVSVATVTNSLSMNSRKIVNVGSATGTTDAPNYGQLGVLQTVFCSVTTSSATSTTSFGTTNNTCTITPKFSTSRVAIYTSAVVVIANASNTLLASIFRGTSDLGSGVAMANVGSTVTTFQLSFNYVDSPATTSATVYTVESKSATGGQTVTYGNGQIQTMILQEIL